MYTSLDGRYTIANTVLALVITQNVISVWGRGIPNEQKTHLQHLSRSLYTAQNQVRHEVFHDWRSRNGANSGEKWSAKKRV